MLTTRRKVLFAFALLAPASVLTVYVEQHQALLRGAWAAWIDPGALTKAVLVIGCLSLIFAVISTVVDLRRGG